MDTDWIELEQDLEHLVVQGAIVSLEALAGCAALFAVVDAAHGYPTPRSVCQQHALAQ